MLALGIMTAEDPALLAGVVLEFSLPGRHDFVVVRAEEIELKKTRVIALASETPRQRRQITRMPSLTLKSGTWRARGGVRRWSRHARAQANTLSVSRVVDASRLRSLPPKPPGIGLPPARSLFVTPAYRPCVFRFPGLDPIQSCHYYHRPSHQLAITKHLGVTSAEFVFHIVTTKALSLSLKMVLKRKRSDCELGPVFSSDQQMDTGSFNFNSMAAMDTARRGFFAPRLSTPSHLPSRTMKRFRDNRPSESEVHRKFE